MLFYLLALIFVCSLLSFVFAWAFRLKYMSKVQHLDSTVDSLSKDLKEKKLEIENLVKKEIESNTIISSLKSDNKHLNNRILEQKDNLTELHNKMKLEFKDLANSILEEKSKRFIDHNKTTIGDILKPFGEKVSGFQRQINEITKEDISRIASLKTEVQKLNELNIQISKDAQSLTTALRGDTKVQGDWGEFILESILEKSGLVKEREYFIQETFRSEEDGRLYKPDIIIKLPDNKNIIIDSKVSLCHYEQYTNSESIEKQDFFIKGHLQSLKSHIKNLSSKEYSLKYGLSSLDFVLMFIPIEPAFALAVQSNTSLFNEAYSKNIVLTSPTTLIATLKTIKYIWKTEMQNKNVEEIARQGGALYDKFVSFTEDIIAVGDQIRKTQQVYQSASKKLYEGKDNLIRKTERLKELGAKTSKNIRLELLEKSGA